jgi:hypothetical protein
MISRRSILAGLGLAPLLPVAAAMPAAASPTMGDVLAVDRADRLDTTEIWFVSWGEPVARRSRYTVRKSLPPVEWRKLYD